MKKLPEYIGTFPTWKDLQDTLTFLENVYGYKRIAPVKSYKDAYIHGDSPRTSLWLSTSRIEGAVYNTSHMSYKTFNQLYMSSPISFKTIYHETI